jgi:hypothetical protein
MCGTDSKKPGKSCPSVRHGGGRRDELRAPASLLCSVGFSSGGRRAPGRDQSLIPSVPFYPSRPLLSVPFYPSQEGGTQGTQSSARQSKGCVGSFASDSENATSPVPPHLLFGVERSGNRLVVRVSQHRPRRRQLPATSASSKRASQGGSRSVRRTPGIQRAHKKGVPETPWCRGGRHGSHVSALSSRPAPTTPTRIPGPGAHRQPKAHR